MSPSLLAAAAAQHAGAIFFGILALGFAVARAVMWPFRKRRTETSDTRVVENTNQDE